MSEARTLSMICTNCTAEVDMQYCPNCGQPAALKRINGQYLAAEVGSLFNVERGIYYTIKELAIHPGASIKNYLTENRRRLVKPIVFIIVTSLIYTLLNHFFNIEDTYIQYSESQAATMGFVFNLVEDNYGYANIIMGVFIALWIKLFFRKYAYNFFEVLVLLCYVMGMGMLIFAVFVVVQILVPANVMAAGGVAGVTYAVWAIGQFFDPKRAGSYIKALCAYMLGMIAFWLAAILAGPFIEMIIK